jgi:membrane protein YqaA with SNARE-associated domain
VIALNSTGVCRSRPAWQESLVGRPGVPAAFICGLAEATFFFIVPDVFLSFVAILDWPRTWKDSLAAIAGALLGGVLLFHWASSNSAEAHAALARVPLIRENMFAKVDDGFRNQGLLSVLLGSVSGLPYKLYAVEAPKIHEPDRISSGNSARTRGSLPPGVGSLRRGRILVEDTPPLARFAAHQNPCGAVDCFLRILLGPHRLGLSASV